MLIDGLCFIFQVLVGLQQFNNFVCTFVASAACIVMGYEFKRTSLPRTFSGRWSVVFSVALKALLSVSPYEARRQTNSDLKVPHFLFRPFQYSLRPGETTKSKDKKRTADAAFDLGDTEVDATGGKGEVLQNKFGACAYVRVAGLSRSHSLETGSLLLKTPKESRHLVK